MNTSKLIPLTEVSKRLPNFGNRPIHLSTLNRWCHKGIDGVRLRYKRVGRRMCVTQASLDNFFDALAAKDLQTLADQAASEVSAKPPSSKRRAKEIDDAQQTLAKAGISKGEK